MTQLDLELRSPDTLSRAILNEPSNLMASRNQVIRNQSPRKVKAFSIQAQARQKSYKMGILCDFWLLSAEAWTTDQKEEAPLHQGPFKTHKLLAHGIKPNSLWPLQVGSALGNQCPLHDQGTTPLTGFLEVNKVRKGIQKAVNTSTLYRSSYWSWQPMRGHISQEDLTSPQNLLARPPAVPRSVYLTS
nr:uncharacterized protein LOC102143783 [Macaca fascicularis]